MNTNEYPLGFVGCTILDLPGTARNSLDEVPIPKGSLVMVVERESGGRIADDDDDTRYHIVLLQRHGREDPRGVSYCGCAYGFLTPEPGVIGWREEDAAAARRQGWDIFDSGGAEEHEPLELCRLDDPQAYYDWNGTFLQDRFEADEDVWLFVWLNALQGEGLAKRALEYLYARSPDEYRKIRDYVVKKGAE